MIIVDVYQGKGHGPLSIIHMWRITLLSINTM